VFDGFRSHIGGLMKAAALAAGSVVRRALTPAAEQGTVRGLVLDLTRSRRELLAENTFLRHQLRDLWFRCHFVFVVMHLESRKILRAVTTREPTSAWLAQQLRELTPSVKVRNSSCATTTPSSGATSTPSPRARARAS
jgi:hypothetical protein